MTLLDHLDELRRHLIRGVAAIALIAVVAFFNKEFIFQDVIMGPAHVDFVTYRWLCQLADWTGVESLCIRELPFTIQNRTMTGQFTMHMLIAGITGAILGFPYFFWELWRFVKPGLYSTEQSATTGTTLAVSMLFLLGVTFSYFVAAPMAVYFLSNYQLDPSIVNEFDLTSYVETIAMIVLSGGVMFQLPIAVYFLARIGLITPSVMRNYRRHAIVVILFIGAIITPPDPVSQVLVSTPIILLYELSIFICASQYRKLQQRAMRNLGKPLEDIRS